MGLFIVVPRGKHVDDTQVDWTKRIETPAPASAPEPAPQPKAGAPGADERLTRAERSLKRSWIALGVLAGILVAAICAVAIVAADACQKLEELSTSYNALEQRVDKVEKLAEASSGAATGAGSWGSSDSAASDDEDTEPLRAADLTGLINQKWSNALRMLEAYGVDPGDLVIVTDDGGSVIDPGNWTVTMVTDIDDTGEVAVHLRHDIDWF